MQIRYAYSSPLRLLAAVIAVDVACDSTTGPRVPEITRVQPAWVTGAAAGALDANGQFVFPPAAFRVTSPERADSIALAFIEWDTTLFSRAGYPDVSLQHGSQVEFGWLSLCKRRYYARTAAGIAPPTMNPNLALYYAPQWILPFCTPGGTPQMDITVADGAYAITVAADTFVPPWFNGNDFDQLGIPAGVIGDMPTTPEEAVEAAALATGARVSEIPVPLVWFPRGYASERYFAICVQWQLHLDRSVLVADSTGAQSATDVLYVFREPVCFPGTIALAVPLSEQPSSFTSPYDSVVIPLVLPTQFKTVTAVH